MRVLIHAMLPEIILTVFAGVLFLLGVSRRPSVRRIAPVLALIAVILAGLSQISPLGGASYGVHALADRWHTVRIFEFARFIKILTAAIGVLLILLAWPTNKDATGNAAMNFGGESGEFFGMMLLSIAGVFMVAGANDLMLLFLGIELASIPTYVMVSISRPLSVAQEAGVKYFFLGAMAAAIMLFGFSYLYGTTGTTTLVGSPETPGIIDVFARQWLHSPYVGAARYLHWFTPWQMLAVVLIIGGFAFKMAAVPMHMYAGDVYQGAATPVTAFLSFVPKISGFVALLKILFVVSGGHWRLPPQIVDLIWWLAVLTMTIGNVLGLLQFNIKRVLAYSSIAHTGYMLVGVTALIATDSTDIQSAAMQGILFYLAIYGLMNIGAFGVLILLPSRGNTKATSAETFEDLAGLGAKHVMLGVVMAVCCFSLIGLPPTVGIFGKYYLIEPALMAHLTPLVVLLVINAAISAAYYLKIVATMFLRPEPAGFFPGSSVTRQPDAPVHHPLPILVSVGVSMVLILWLGMFWPATQRLTNRVDSASAMEPTMGSFPPAVSVATADATPR